MVSTVSEDLVLVGIIKKSIKKKHLAVEINLFTLTLVQ